MLLNPGRAERVEVAERGRSSGGFTGLVRHVVELSAVGELPFALDVGTEEQEHADEPMGCAIEYVLPAGQVGFSIIIVASRGGLEGVGLADFFA